MTPTLHLFTVAMSSILVISSNAGVNHRLYFSTSVNISLLNTNGDSITVATGQGVIQTIDIDYRQGLLFWLEYEQNVIRRANILEETGNLTNVTDVFRPKPKGSTIDTFAVDWIYSHIYVGNNNNGVCQMQVTDFDGSFIKTFRSIGQGYVTDIVVDPQAGWLFYIRWAWRPVLGRMKLSGTVYRTVMLDSEISGTQPRALSADYGTKRLYWIDVNMNRISSVDYDGGNKIEIPLNNGHIIQPQQSIILHDTMYWTDKKDHSIRRVNIRTGGNATVVVQNLKRRPYAICALDEASQPAGENVCIKQKNQRCRQICLPRPHDDYDDWTYSCKCPDEVPGVFQLKCRNSI